MFSLPDLVAMNDRAAKSRRAHTAALRTGKLGRAKIKCEHHGADCVGAVRHFGVYDIFSDDPKSVLGLCEKHDGYYGSPDEGLFECAGCNRTFYENYTWEVYSAVDRGEQVCLNCLRDRVVADDANWIPLTDAAIAAVDFTRVRQAKHIFAVGQNGDRGANRVRSGLQFIDNAEFDSLDGRQISGDGIQSVLRAAQAQGHPRALLALDAAYQFAVSIGVYVDAKPPRRARQPKPQQLVEA